MAKKILIIAMVFLTLLRMGIFLSRNSLAYTADYWSRYPTLKIVFEGSQYMMKDSTYLLPDETVYSYAAGAYAKGANPILVESTQPPLGKYLLSLSVLLFHNENVIVAVFFIFFLIGIGWVTFLLSKSSVLSVFAVLLLTFDTLFTNQLRYVPLLDIFVITFILWGVTCAAVGLRKSNPMLYITGLVLIGLSMLIKVWVTGAIFLGVVSLYTAVVNRPYVRHIIVAYVIIFLALLAVYSSTIASGYSALEILKVQKWLFWYHESKINRLFTIWPLIFLNKWYVWWGNIPVIQDPNWILLWPIIIGIYVLEVLRKLVVRSIRYHDSLWDLIFFCMLAYSLFISIGQANARYLLPLLSFAYPFGCAVVYRTFFTHKRI